MHGSSCSIEQLNEVKGNDQVEKVSGVSRHLVYTFSTSLTVPLVRLLARRHGVVTLLTVFIRNIRKLVKKSWDSDLYTQDTRVRL